MVPIRPKFLAFFCLCYVPSGPTVHQSLVYTFYIVFLLAWIVPSSIKCLLQFLKYCVCFSFLYFSFRRGFFLELEAFSFKTASQFYIASKLPHEKSLNHQTFIPQQVQEPPFDKVKNTFLWIHETLYQAQQPTWTRSRTHFAIIFFLSNLNCWPKKMHNCYIPQKTFNQ